MPLTGSVTTEAFSLTQIVRPSRVIMRYSAKSVSKFARASASHLVIRSASSGWITCSHSSSSVSQASRGYPSIDSI